MILKSDRFQTIYRVTEKCGTTSFYQAILNWHGFRPGGPPRVYLRHNRREIAKTGLIEENVKSENLESYYDRHRDYIWFSTIRHPVSRIQSTYRNKLNRYARRFKYAAYLRGKFRQFLSQPKSWSDMNRLSSNIGKYISFAEFIEGLTVNGIDWDPHYMSLTQLLRPDVVKYDCLLRLRTLGADYQKLLGIMEERGICTKDFERLPILNASSSGNGTKSELTESLKSKIAQLYSADILAFWN